MTAHFTKIDRIRSICARLGEIGPAMPDHVSALHLLLSADRALVAIVGLSLAVSFSAVLCGSIIGIPFGWANLKLIPISLMPLGREVVQTDEGFAGR